VSTPEQVPELGSVADETSEFGRVRTTRPTRLRRPYRLQTVPPIGPAPTTAEPIVPIRRDATLRRLLAGADLIAAAAALLVIDLMTGRGFAAAGLIDLPLIVPIAKLMGRYDQDDMLLRRSTIDEVPMLGSTAALWALTWSLIALITGDRFDLGGGGVAVLWLTMGVLIVVLRALARLVALRITPWERVLIVGSAHARERLANSLGTDPSARIEIVGFLPLEDERRDSATDWGRQSRRKLRRTFDDLARVVVELTVDRVFLIPTSADSETMLEAVNRTTALGVNVSIVPRLFEVVGSAVEFDTVGGVTVLGVRRPGLSRSSRLVKRCMDLVGAAIGLLALSPVFAIVALLIKLGSPGPVFFAQDRVGRNGEPFRMLKFRSMVDGAEAQRSALEARNETAGLFKVKDDPRITRIGGGLRRTSIDELPQLINVLKGDMSLVGPRPLVLDEDRLVEGRHRSRLQLPPGMTGPWQVLGPTRPPLSEMVKTDYLYATNWSLWSDIKTILRTFAHIAGKRGL
jgi:exopolysaccharide biosynthesis polyprenyl glycosylphosphotransferase